MTKPPANPAKSPWADIEALRAQSSMSEDQVPAGAFTVGEYAANYKLTYKGAENHIMAWLNAGKLSRGRRRVKNTNRLAWHYWTTKGPNAQTR